MEGAAVRLRGLKKSFSLRSRFGDAVKGLHVYGAKVIRSAALSMLIESKA